MSHELNMNANGQYSFMYNRQNGLPWHGLGTPVDGAVTALEAMQKAFMNWTVSKRQLSIEINGVYQFVDAWGIFRNDNNVMLGSVGNQYTVIQNYQAFDFVDTLLENIDGAHYDTAGVLYNGEQIFLSATIPYSIAPDRALDDKTNCYLMFTSSHDGSLSATTKLTTVRVVCNNTLSHALNSQGMGTLKVRHSKNGTDKLDRAKRLVTGMTQSVETLKEKFNTLANRKVNKDINKAVMSKLLGNDWQESTQKRNQVEKIATLFSYNDGNAYPEIAGSAYALLQSVTNYVDHERGVRITDKVNNLSESQIRTQNAIFNGGDQLKQQALEIILQETEQAEEMPALKKVFQSVDIAPKKPELDNILNMINV